MEADLNIFLGHLHHLGAGEWVSHDHKLGERLEIDDNRLLQITQTEPPPHPPESETEREYFQSNINVFNRRSRIESKFDDHHLCKLNILLSLSRQLVETNR